MQLSLGHASRLLLYKRADKSKGNIIQEKIETSLFTYDLPYGLKTQLASDWTALQISPINSIDQLSDLVLDAKGQFKIDPWIPCNYTHFFGELR